MIRSALTLNGRLVFATIAAFAALMAISPCVAQAHDTAGVPYHTKPTLASAYKYTTDCLYSFHSPSVVLGFQHEYVYWQPVAAFYANGKWNYRYGDAKRAEVDQNTMIFGWTNMNGTFSNGDAGVWVPPGTDIWLGYQIMYGSNGYLHFDWLGGGARC
jgi:hypothetical protein